MTQNELAEKVGVKPQTMSGWLSGKRDPGVPKIAKMADALKVSLDRLYGRVPPGAKALLELHKQATGIATAVEQLVRVPVGD